MDKLILPRTPALDGLSRHEYFTFLADDDVTVLSSQELHMLSESRPVMSLRVSTGVLGELDCAAGNAGPKGPREVVAGAGLGGISALLKLGALPCLTCLSGKRLIDFDDPSIHAQLIENVDGEIERAMNVDWLGNNYDARRLDWSILSSLGVVPTRLYVRPQTTRQEAIEVFSNMSLDDNRMLSIGYFDSSLPDRFREIL